jgi:hypothetical protein
MDRFPSISGYLLNDFQNRCGWLIAGKQSCTSWKFPGNPDIFVMTIPQWCKMYCKLATNRQMKEKFLNEHKINFSLDSIYSTCDLPVIDNNE